MVGLIASEFERFSLFLPFFITLLGIIADAKNVQPYGPASKPCGTGNAHCGPTLASLHISLEGATACETNDPLALWVG
jgi:hypothetical protein